MTTVQRSDVAPTGTPGLDDILMGGLPRAAVHLVQGAPGTGKTTLGLQFLREGVKRGERGAYFSLSQSGADLARIARSHDMDLDEIVVHELSRTQDDDLTNQTILMTAEAELEAMMRSLHRLLDTRPDRLVLDSLLEIRMLSATTNTYRHEIPAIKRRLEEQKTTALFIDITDLDPRDPQIEALVHGVLSLDRQSPAVGVSRRRIQIEKMRAHPVVEGFHDMRIERGGLRVFPRILPETVAASDVKEQLASGVEGLDQVLGGGLEWGTTTILLGQSGAGKSTIATLFAREAAAGDKRAALFLFEERPEVLRSRSRSLGVGLEGFERSQHLALHYYGFSSASPGEFCRAVVDAVEEAGAELVVIDSLTGMLASMPEHEGLIAQLSRLLAYLGRRGVLTILVITQHGLMTPENGVDVDLSYLADNIILLRQYASGSEIRRSIAAVKKRHSFHRTDIRELVIDPDGVSVKSAHEIGAGGRLLGGQMS